MKDVRRSLPFFAWQLMALLACIALVTYILRSPTTELPVYQGKTLCQWIAELDRAADHPTIFQDAEAAQSAIRAIGTNALPFALANLHARVTPADLLTAWLAKHAPFL